MGQSMGELRAFVIFNAGVSPPVVVRARGCTVAELVALQSFNVQPVQEVAQTGLVFPSTGVPAGAIGGPTLMDAAIGSDAGLGFRDVALRDDGGVGARVVVIDAAGAAANAAAGQTIVVRFWRTPAVD